jgi:Family of unknown function (DUF5856)
MATKNPTPTAGEATESMVKPDNDNSVKGEVESYYGNSDEVSTNAVAHEFFFVLLQAAVVAHQLHLGTRSIAEHLALDTFYKELPDLTDELIETYQGKYGLVHTYPAGVKMPDHKDARALLQNLVSYIAATRAQVAPDTYLQNQIDEIEKLAYSTLNKLKFYY